MTAMTQAVLNGLLLGCIYAGFGLGLSLILGILRIVNVAHSAVLIAASLVYLELVNRATIDPFLSIILVVAAFYLVGLGMYESIVKRLAREHTSTVLLVFFGLMVLIESIAVLIWTTDTRTVQLGYLSSVLSFWELRIPLVRAVAAALTLAVLLALHVLLSRTLIGSAVRAIAQNPDVAAMNGIDVYRLSRNVFAAGIALTAFGGTILALVVPFSPQEHMRWLAWSFLVVIVGGLGSVANTLLAGLAVGVTESLAGLALPFQYTYLLLYAVLAVALLVRRHGLGGVSTRAV